MKRHLEPSLIPEKRGNEIENSADRKNRTHTHTRLNLFLFPHGTESLVPSKDCTYYAGCEIGVDLDVASCPDW